LWVGKGLGEILPDFRTFFKNCFFPSEALTGIGSMFQFWVSRLIPQHFKKTDFDFVYAILNAFNL